MYKTFIYLICGCFILHSCISNKSSISSKKASLPSFIACDSIISIVDSGTEFNQLEDLAGFSYSHNYNLVFIPGDSLSKEVIRDKNAKLAQFTVKKIFPDVQLASDTNFKNLNYNDVMHLTSRLIQSDFESEELKMLVDKLIVSDESQKQLFIETRYYLLNSQFKNYLKFFVFDVADKKLLYYDHLEYSCDFRDEAAYYQVLNYGLEKIKKNSE